MEEELKLLNRKISKLESLCQDIKRIINRINSKLTEAKLLKHNNDFKAHKSSPKDCELPNWCGICGCPWEHCKYPIKHREELLEEIRNPS